MSISDEIAKQASSLSSKTDDLWGLFTKGVGAYIDKETRADDIFMPGIEDQVYQSGFATPLQQNVQPSSGMSPLMIGGIIAGVVVGVVVLKRVL